MHREYFPYVMDQFVGGPVRVVVENCDEDRWAEFEYEERIIRISPRAFEDSCPYPISQIIFHECLHTIFHDIGWETRLQRCLESDYEPFLRAVENTAIAPLEELFYMCEEEREPKNVHSDT